MPGAPGIRGEATRKMPVSRRQDHLCEVPGALFQTENENRNPGHHAVLRPQDDLPASGDDNSSFDGRIAERAES
jgi:hypothetical protein